MNLYPVETGNFKLDGGAMFGVVPKVIWNKTNPADNNNMCNWAMRSLLIEDADRLILIDTGIGDKQSEKFFSHFHLNGNDTLQSSLKKLGFTTDDVTDVLLTHLHFDHVGGAVIRNDEKYQAFNYTGMSIVKTELLRKFDKFFKNAENFEQEFYPRVIKKFRTELIKVKGFWHSIDSVKDLDIVNNSSVKNQKFKRLKSLKNFLKKNYLKN